MISHDSAHIRQIDIHHVGLTSIAGSLRISERPAHFQDDRSRDYFLTYTCSPFTHPEYFGFDTAQDSLYPIIQAIFTDPSSLHHQSKAIAKRLYHMSDHPAIKGGELVIAYLDDVILEDELLSAIAIFKVEQTDPFLNIQPKDGTYTVDRAYGIALSKAEKGCMIFNTQEADGYKIVCLDKRARPEANYWAKDFLNIRERSDDYHFTEKYIQLTKSFIDDKAKKEGNLSKIEQADIMLNSHSFLKKMSSLMMRTIKMQFSNHQSYLPLFLSIKKPTKMIRP